MRSGTMVIGIIIIILAIPIYSWGTTQISEADSTINYYENTHEGQLALNADKARIAATGDWSSAHDYLKYLAAYDDKNNGVMAQGISMVILFIIGLPILLIGVFSSGPKKERTIHEVLVENKRPSIVQNEIHTWFKKNELEVMTNTSDKLLAKGGQYFFIDITLSVKEKDTSALCEFYLKLAKDEEQNLNATFFSPKTKERETMDSFITFLKELSSKDQSIKISSDEEEFEK